MADITDTSEGAAVEDAWDYFYVEYVYLLPNYWYDIDNINNTE